METGDVIGAVAIGVAAGMFSGLVGVGGGVVFVPGLVLFLGESPLEAVATSLLAIVFVAGVGAWRQAGYGNLRLRDGLLVGVLAPLGVIAGTALAHAVGERALELSFAGVQLFLAFGLARRVIRPSPGATG